MSKKEHKQDKKKSEKEQVNKTEEPGKSEKLGRKEYENALEQLHVELVKLQQWVVHTGARVAIIFEGRDGAGKGGTIRRSRSGLAHAYFASSPCLPLPIGKKARCTCNGI